MKGILNFLARANLMSSRTIERLAAAEAEQAAADTQAYAAAPADAADAPAEIGGASPPPGSQGRPLALRQSNSQVDRKASPCPTSTPPPLCPLRRMRQKSSCACSTILSDGRRDAARSGPGDGFLADDNWQISRLCARCPVQISALGAYKEQLTGADCRTASSKQPR